MAMKIVPFSEKDEALIIEVLKNVRRQKYTPEKLCQLQKVIETKYYYWWIMDMKKEEYAVELFGDNFSGTYNGYDTGADALSQARSSKWVNAPMVTMHMGHQPLVWLIDENHARGIFQYQDHQIYKEDGYKVETWMVYIDDFERDENDVWHLKTLRMAVKQMDGSYKNVEVPENWEPEVWEEVDF